MTRLLARSIGLFSLLITLYFLTFTGWPVSGDEQVMFDGAHSFFRNGSLELGYFNNLRPYFPPPRVDNRPVLWLDVEPLQAYLAAGLIWLAVKLGGIGLVHAAWTLNLWVTALTAVILYHYGLALGYRDRTAFVVALIFGVATIAWPYSRLFFREPLFTLLALSCAYVFERWRTAEHPRRAVWLLLAALLLAGMLLTKGVGLLLIPGFLVIALPAVRRRLINGQVLLIILILINFVAAILIIYEQTTPSPRYRYVIAWLRSADLSFSLEAIAAYLFSPGLSLWVFSPTLILSLLGAHFLRKDRRYREFLFPLVTAVSFIIGYSIFFGENWYGGLGWGPRYLVPLTPFLCLWLLPVVDRALMRWRSGLRALAAAMVTVSILVQVIGALSPLEAYGAYLARESARLDRMIYAWQDGTWNLPYTPLVISLRLLGSSTQIAWLVNHSAAVVLPLGLLTTILASGAILVRATWGRRAASIGALISVTIMFLAGLRSFYADPRFGGDDQTLWGALGSLQPHPGDAIILNDSAYRNFFMNYYTDHEPIYVMPDAPGERSEPDKLPIIVSDNPEEQAHPYTWILLSRLAPTTARWLFVTEFSPYSPGRTRPTEHFLVRHYFLEHETFSTSTVRVMIFDPVEAPSDRTPPAQTLSVELGAVTLAGLDLPSGNDAQAGMLFPVSLVWRHDRWPPGLAPFDYSVNLSLVSESGAVVAQYAGPPLGTFGAMSGWAAGSTYRDNHALAIPDGTPAGEYELLVLLYDWRNGKPLADVGDGVVIAHIHLTHP